MADTLSFIIEGILLTIVSTFGLIGNLLSVFVLTRSIKNSTSVPPNGHGGQTFSILLRGLATFDALFLMAAILSFGLPNMSQWYTDNVFMRLMATLFGLLHTFRTGSVYVTLAVTYERFHSIICPLKQMRFKRNLLSFVVAFSVLYNIPKYFEMTTKTHPKTGSLYIESTPMRQNPTYIEFYVFWSKLILVEAIPYVSIVIMNVFIIMKLSKSNRFRRNFYQGPRQNRAGSTTEQAVNGVARTANIVVQPSTGNAGHQARVENGPPRSNNGQSNSNGPANNGETDKSLSFILMTMSGLFIVCQSLKIIPDLYELFICRTRNLTGHHCTMDGPVINAIVRISHLLVCFNSSVNFLIYYVYGTKFRKAWRQTYGPMYKSFCDFLNRFFRRAANPMPDVVSMPLQPMAVHFRGGTISPGTERYSEELEKFVQFRAVHGPTLV